MNRYATEARAAEALALAMIWNGTMGTLLPVEHCLAFKRGPGWWRNTMDWFAARPKMTRGVSLAEVGAGLWVAVHAGRFGSSAVEGQTSTLRSSQPEDDPAEGPVHLPPAASH